MANSLLFSSLMRDTTENGVYRRGILLNAVTAVVWPQVAYIHLASLCYIFIIRTPFATQLRTHRAYSVTVSSMSELSHFMPSAHWED